VSTPSVVQIWDILNDTAVLAKLVVAHGGQWADLTQLHKQATDEFRGPVEPPRVDEVKQKIVDALEKQRGATKQATFNCHFKCRGPSKE
jgi:hypothetical protein